MTVQSKPMQDGRSAANAARHTYNKSGVIAVACVALVLFIVAWLFNGYFTARTAAGVGRWFGWSWLTWGVGWCVHLTISVCEQHAWKVPAYARTIPALREVYLYILVAMWVLAVIVGSIDTLTTAVGLIGMFHVESSIGQFVCVILAEATAVLPEPVIVGLVIFLIQIRRR